MSKLMKFFASIALVASLLAFAPGNAEARWADGWHGGGWHTVVVGVADGAAGAEADEVGVRPSVWALPPHLLGVSDQVGAGDLAGAIHIGTRPVPVAVGCLSRVWRFGRPVLRSVWRCW